MTDEFRRAAYQCAADELAQAKIAIREGREKNADFAMHAAEMRARRILSALEGKSVPDFIADKIRSYLTPKVLTMRQPPQSGSAEGLHDWRFEEQESQDGKL